MKPPAPPNLLPRFFFIFYRVRTPVLGYNSLLWQNFPINIGKHYKSLCSGFFCFFFMTMISVVVLIFRIHETCTHCNGKRLYKADLTRSLDCTAKVKASLCHGLQGTVDVGFAGMKEMRLEGNR